jgi:hypothetical protein
MVLCGAQTRQSDEIRRLFQIMDVRCVMWGSHLWLHPSQIPYLISHIEGGYLLRALSFDLGICLN